MLPKILQQVPLISICAPPFLNIEHPFVKNTKINKVDYCINFDDNCCYFINLPFRIEGLLMFSKFFFLRIEGKYIT